MACLRHPICARTPTGGGVAELALSKLPSGGIGDAIPEGNPDSLISATVQTGHFLVVRHAMSMGRVVLF